MFAVVVGIAAVLNGAIMLLAPDQFQSPIFDPVHRTCCLRWGSCWAASESSTAHLYPATPTPISWGSHLLLGMAMRAFGPPTALPNRAFTSIAYYNGFGALIGMLPWLRPRLRRSDPPRCDPGRAAPGSPSRCRWSSRWRSSPARSSGPPAPRHSRAPDHRRDAGARHLDYVDLHRAAGWHGYAQPGLLRLLPETQHAICVASPTYPDA